MGFQFGMSHKPDYQRRKGKCNFCAFPIESGARVVVGQTYIKIKGMLYRQRRRYHENCFWTAIQTAVEKWFFDHDYTPEYRPYSTTDRSELNRLNSRLYYLRKKGVTDDDVVMATLLAQKSDLQERRKKRNG